jgi:hypothetical protein
MAETLAEYGGRGWDRTSDPYDVNVAPYVETVGNTRFLHPTMIVLFPAWVANLFTVRRFTEPKSTTFSPPLPLLRGRG